MRLSSPSLTILFEPEFGDRDFGGSAFLAEDQATVSAVSLANEEAKLFWTPMGNHEREAEKEKGREREEGRRRN